MRTIQIEDNSNGDCLTVVFLENKAIAGKFQFFNYFGNPDILARVMVDFVKHGAFPDEEKGLIDISA